MSTTAVESFQFQSETRQLLHLMIHSLYTEREVFLRELISNALYAPDGLALESLRPPGLVEEGHVYELRLKPDSKEHTLTISDTGIGMSRDELVANIGTIARSGTQELRKRIEEASSTQSFSDLIGQFGVGFYSAFMVSDRGMIVTRGAGEETATQRESPADGTYTIAPGERAKVGA